MAGNPDRDYCEVLGLARDASPKAIKDAFRKLAMKYHPDRNKAPDAEERFKEVAKAYAVLSDPNKKADYDHHGFAGVAGFSHEDLFGDINFEDILGGMGFGFGGGLFDHFFDRRPVGPPKGRDIEMELVIPLVKVVSGGEEKVRVNHPTVCKACHGSGAKSGTSPRECVACKGTGHKTVARRRGKKDSQVLIQQLTVCPECHGRGKVIDQPCIECGGSGQTMQGETLMVKIPVGIDEGKALRVPERGMPSAVPSGVPGDLYVVVRTEPDARFMRDGANLWHSVMISPADAALGVALVVPTLDGKLELAVRRVHNRMQYCVCGGKVCRTLAEKRRATCL